MYFIRERERERRLLNHLKTRARICAKYNHLHLIFKEKLSYFKVAFVVYFLQFISVETQCLRLGLHPHLRLDLHSRLRLGLRSCLRLGLKSFEKEIQDPEMSGNKMSGNETQEDETQGNETQALRLYRCTSILNF